MQTFGYIILIILLMFTLLNFYAQIVSKRKRKVGEAQFKALAARMERVAYEEMRRRHITFDEKRHYVNDKDQGILLCADNARQLLGLVIDGDFTLIPFDAIKEAKCVVHYLDDAKKHYDSIDLVLDTKDETMTIHFATKHYRTKGFFGDFMLKNSEDCAFLINHYRDKAASGKQENKEPDTEGKEHNAGREADDMHEGN